MARLLFILNLIFILSSGFVRAQDTIPLNVIRNEKSVPSEMNMDQLKAVLRGEKLRWNDGAKVSIALMKTNTDVGVKTCERIYNMTANELNKYFLALVFQGKVKAPTFFSSLSDLEEYVAQTPGAIGVVEHTEKELNIITVDGKKQI